MFRAYFFSICLLVKLAILMAFLHISALYIWHLSARSSRNRIRAIYILFACRIICKEIAYLEIMNTTQKLISIYNNDFFISFAISGYARRSTRHPITFHTTLGYRSRWRTNNTAGRFYFGTPA